MPADFTLDTPRRIVFSRGWGALTDGDLFGHMAHMKALLESGVLDSTWAQVFDLTDVESLAGVSSNGVRRLVSDSPWPEDVMRIVVTSTDAVFGLVRMYQLMGVGATQHVRAVRSMAEAEALLSMRGPRRTDAT